MAGLFGGSREEGTLEGPSEDVTFELSPGGWEEANHEESDHWELFLCPVEKRRLDKREIL